MTTTRRICRFLIGLSIWFSAGVALACGGFFAPVPMDQTMERLVISINSDETITAYIGIGYAGEASEFSWLLPVPNTPQVEIADTALLDMLETYTRRQFLSPASGCNGVIWSEFEGVGGGGGPGSVQEGSVGPYDYAILDDRDGAVIVAWLEDNGYLVPEAAVPIINDYARSGLQFLAMKLQPTAQVGDIQPVKITFSGTKPVIPIKLMKIASLDPLPILVWIFADTQYMPENYAHPAVDYSTFDSQMNFGNPRLYQPPNVMYEQALTDIQAEYDGQAFVTEYAAPAATLRANLSPAPDAELVWLLDNYAYVTRLRAQLSPAQMTQDVAFIPAQDAPDDSTQIDLRDYLDPIDYWGCSTPVRLSSGTSETLTPTLTVDGTPLWIPDGWRQSQLLTNFTAVHIYSPEVVTVDMLRAFLADEATPPMLVMFRGITGGAEADFALTQLVGSNYPVLENNHWQSITMYQPFAPLEQGRHTHINLLTTHDDYLAHQADYDAMLEFAGSYPFYAHPELRHTLFLTGGSYGEDPQSIQLGFPAEWRAHWRSEDESVILPVSVTNTADLTNTPAIYVRSLPTLFAKTGIEYVAELYNLPEATLEAADDPACGDQVIAIEFTQAGRRGYFTLYHDYLIEASAPEALFADYDGLLRTAVSSVEMPFVSCG
jgi:hypothetical protein